MISAASSIASGILSGAFGTSAQPSVSIPGASTASTSSTVSQASIDETLLASSESPQASLLSNIAFAQDTEFLLNDPHSNGAITGTPSNYVQQIISKLAPGAQAAPANSSANSNASTAAASNAPTSLPPEGIVA